jgi:hypothetical protein
MMGLPTTADIQTILAQCLSVKQSDRKSGESGVALLTANYPDVYALFLITTLCSSSQEDLRLLSASQFNLISYPNLAILTRLEIKVFGHFLFFRNDYSSS